MPAPLQVNLDDIRKVEVVEVSTAPAQVEVRILNGDGLHLATVMRLWVDGQGFVDADTPGVDPAVCRTNAAGQIQLAGRP